MRARGLIAALALGPAGLGSCAPNGGAPAELAARVGEEGPIAVQGTVRQVGNLPFERTVVEGEATVTVAGEYESELASLAGARVRATGEWTRGSPGPYLRVSGYEVLSVDGERPAVGRLVREDERWFLQTLGGRVSLQAVPQSFEALIGARLWAVVDPEGTVHRYGVLRDAEAGDDP